MTLTQVAPINTSSWAFKAGVADATSGKPAAAMFASPRQQAEYDAGYESVKPVAKPITVPQLKRNVGREFIRKTDSAAEAVFKADAARQTRIDAMFAKTAALSPEYAGDLLWAV